MMYVVITADIVAAVLEALTCPAGTMRQSSFCNTFDQMRKGSPTLALPQSNQERKPAESSA
jgi:hypothetical protein